MNHCVPEFEMDAIPTSSSAQKRKSRPEDEIMELMWQDGEVVMQKSVNKFESAARDEKQNQLELFMEEDEMASWLHYPLNDAAFDQDFCADLLYPNAMRPPSFVAAERHKVESSSPGCSSGDQAPPTAQDRKRKGPSHYHTEDAEFESADAKQQSLGSTSTKRARAAEVHNLSERRRRDRINEKMKALQELIPRCNKSDKASMLDEAIEYLKSLQLQVQMMSMGCSMVPMMFPGMQQYMPPMGLGMGMGIGMGMEMGMNRPMMHFPNVLPGSAMPPATAAPGHLGPRFPMPPVPATPDQSRIQGNNHSDTVQINNPLSMQNPNQPRIPHFADPYHQYLGLHQMQLPPPPQNQGMAQPSTSRGGAEDPENDQPG